MRQSHHMTHRKRKGSLKVFEEDTTVITITIPKRLLESLKSFIRLKYGKEQKGALSYEISQAIHHYLKKEGIPRKKTDVTIPKYLAVYNKVKELIQKTKGEDVKVVRYKDLAWAISIIRGSHPQTIRTWISTFVKMKVIEPIGVGKFLLKA